MHAECTHMVKGGDPVYQGHDHSCVTVHNLAPDGATRKGRAGGHATQTDSARL